MKIFFIKVNHTQASGVKLTLRIRSVGVPFFNSFGLIAVCYRCFLNILLLLVGDIPIDPGSGIDLRAGGIANSVN